jgi:hypothetical protein
MELRIVMVARTESLRQQPCSLNLRAQQRLNFAVHLSLNGNTDTPIR